MKNRKMLLLTGVAVMCAFTSPYYGAGKPKAETAAETEAKTDKTEGVTEKVKGVASEVTSKVADPSKKKEVTKASDKKDTLSSKGEVKGSTDKGVISELISKTEVGASETEADTEANTEVTPQDVKKKIESITDIALGLEETEADVAETETEKEVKKPKSVLKDVKWTDFEIAIDEEIMKFPLSVSSLKEGGWLIEAAYKGTELQPYSYIEAQAKKGEHIAYFYIANMTDRPAIADDSTVVGIKVSNTKWSLEDPSIIELPGGVFRGITTEKELLEIYDEPSGSFSLDGVTTYSFIINEYERYDVEINTTGVVDGFKMINFTIPEGVEVIEVKAEPTEEVKSYKANKKMSDSLADFDVKMGDLVVTLPAPVSYFVENGWKVTNGEGAVVGRGESWVTLEKGDKKIETIVTNVLGEAQDVSNCWVDSIDFGDGYNDDFVISGNIKVGSTKEDVLNAIADAGIEYTESEIGDYTYIEYNMPDQQAGFLISLYSADDKTYPKDTVTYISAYRSYDGVYGSPVPEVVETEAIVETEVPGGDNAAIDTEGSTDAVVEDASAVTEEGLDVSVEPVAE